MIALLDVRADPKWHGRAKTVSALPPIPAARFSGMLARCRSEGDVLEVLDWWRALHQRRPLFVFGLICPPRACAEALGGFPAPVHMVVDARRLRNDRVPAAILDRLASSTLQTQLLEEVVDSYGARVLEEADLLKHLVMRGAGGGTAGRASREIGLSEDTVSRRLKRFGIRPGLLMREVRHRAYELRIEAGAPPSVALRAGGWSDPKARRKSRRRLRP